MRWLSLLVLLGALIIAAGGSDDWFGLGAGASTKAPLCAESQAQAEQARALVQDGLNKALVEHTTRLFRVWLSIGVEGRENAARGVQNEVKGWLYAQHVVAEWKIPLCGATK